ncbi:hypothetical protein [Thalassobacillus hwangdonensis]|uniref:DUF5590 domain-containing protein n=1 Tax=Thalassobacillus hwangdonensis TaxID=546108 RepID=A0ABW3L4D0_9BACI
MGKKRIGIIIGVLTLVLVVSYYFYNSKQELYGNDKDSIVKVIKSIDDYENKEVEILEISDFNDVRIVGFLSNDSPSYIEFIKNQKENYVWRHIESRDNESFSMFSPLSGSSKMMVVTNYENKIAKMQVDINGKPLEQIFTPHQANVTWVDKPQTNKDSYEYRNYKYYDINGNLIKEN